MTPTNPQPDAAIALLDSLPTLPAIAVRMLHVTADQDSDARDVAEILRADQSLTAKILSVANSAAMGIREPVGSVDRAIVMLGFQAVRRIVLAVKVFECFTPDGRFSHLTAFDRVGFWKHSLGVASAARRLAEASGLGVRAEDAFVAGLLHDLGKVALHTVYPKAYDRIATRTEHERCDISDQERLLLGIDHTVAGRRLAERWKLPPALREAIWLHHLAPDALPKSARSAALISIVHLADTLVREQRIGYSGNFLFYEHSDEAAARMGISPAQLATIASKLVDDVAEQAELLDLERETPQAMYFEALSRANNELGRLNDELRNNNRKMAAAARYFRAQAECDGQLEPDADLRTVVHALAGAGLTAFQRSRIAAFARRGPDGGFEAAWRGAGDVSGAPPLGNPDDELERWIAEIGGLARPAVIRAPRVMQRLLSPLSAALGPGEMWLVLITHRDTLQGGFAFASDNDERGRLAPEAQELLAFLASAALAIGRSVAQAAARQLSDDLADANRTMSIMREDVLRIRSLSTMAEMAAGAGHELNNPLAVISGRAQMLAEMTEDPEMQRSLKLIHEKAHECSRIVSELMDFARPRPPKLTVTSVGTLLDDARTTWAAEHPPATVQLSTEAQEGLADVSVDRDQLAVVFRELFRNALLALTGELDGRVAITARRPPGSDAVEFLIRDTGCGMTATILKRVFDPFYSHRSAGRGRGLGLPRAHRIIDAHGGQISINSRSGEGTVVRIVLPPASPSDSRGTSAAEPNTNPSPKQSETPIGGA